MEQQLLCVIGERTQSVSFCNKSSWRIHSAVLLNVHWNDFEIILLCPGLVVSMLFKGLFWVVIVMNIDISSVYEFCGWRYLSESHRDEEHWASFRSRLSSKTTSFAYCWRSSSILAALECGPSAIGFNIKLLMVMIFGARIEVETDIRCQIWSGPVLISTWVQVGGINIVTVQNQTQMESTCAGWFIVYREKPRR